ncbi:MAG: hypothetical protein EBW12_06530 [Actinobacteria bacterium]|nr:hypothetical protein [Actinomycetota bacterium]
MSTSDLLLLGIVLFVLIDFSAGMVINYLNERSKNQPLSAEGAEIFNPEEYAKSMAYGTAKYRFEMLTTLISTVAILAAIILGGFSWLDAQLRERFGNDLLITVVFIGILILIATIARTTKSVLDYRMGTLCCLLPIHVYLWHAHLLANV